jgi:ATP-dependent RNA helicase DDX54/DBP10
MSEVSGHIFHVQSRFALQEGKDKKVKTEDGRWVRASYKSGRYEEWKKRNRMQAEQMKWEEADGSDDEAVPSKKSNKKPDGKKRGIQVLGTSGGYGRGRGGGGGKFSRGGSFRGRGELRTGEQVLKDRKMKKKKELAMQRRKFKGGRGARGGGTRGGRGARGRR